MADKFRAIDVNGEPLYGEGMLNYFTGNDAIAMDVVTRLRSVIGDCFFDLEANIDWDNILGSRNYKKERVDEDIKKVILATDGVASINSFSSYIEDRIYYAIFSISLDNGGNVNIKFDTIGVTNND